MKKTQLAAGSQPPRVAIFTGNDTIGREKAKAEFVAAVYRIDAAASEEHFDPSSERFEQFAARMLTPSLFAQTRIFHVRHANQLSDADAAELAAVMRFDIPDVYLIVEFDEEWVKKAGQKKSAALDVKGLVKEGAGRFVLFEFVKPPDYKIPEWLVQQVPRLFGRSIMTDDAAFLVECVGTELDILYSELQKLDIHLPATAPVDRAAIEHICGATRTRTAFDLAQALGSRDLPQSLDILDSLFSTSFSAPMVIGAVFRHFWGLFRIRAWMQAYPDKARRYLNKSLGWEAQTAMAHEIGVAAGLLKPGDSVKKAYPVIVRPGMVQQARSFDDGHLDDIICWLRDYDVEIKTGRAEADKNSFQLLCYKIVRAGNVGRQEKK